MAENRLGKLAGRMKQEIDQEESRRKAAEDQKSKLETDRKAAESRIAKRRAEAQKARAALLEDLRAFGEELGHVATKADEEGLTLTFRSRSVRFEVDGPEDRIALRIPGEVVPRNHHLTRDGDTWEMVFDHGTIVNRFGLEDGLEELLRNQLQVPLPKAGAKPAADEEKGKGKGKGRGGKVTPGSAVQELKSHLE